MGLKDNYVKKNTNLHSDQASRFDNFDSKKYDVFIRNLLFDDDPTYKKEAYIKGLPTDIGSMNAIEMRVNKMKYDKYYFAPNFHRIASEKICNGNESSIWVLLSSLVTSLKCINFPLTYYASPLVNKPDVWKIYFERLDYKNILNSISNKEIIFQVGLAFYYMYKNRVWCQTPTFDMYNINKTKVVFKINSLGFQFELSRIIVLSPNSTLINMEFKEKAYLNVFLSLIDKQVNYSLNRPYNSFIEFFLFEFYDKLLQQVLLPLKNRSNEITSASIISTYHKAGSFVQFKYHDKIFTGILLERLENAIGENFNNCIIAYFNEVIDIALVNEYDVYISNGPLISFLSLTIGE
jgi:hypothetical protein